MTLREKLPRPKTLCVMFLVLTIPLLSGACKIGASNPVAVKIVCPQIKSYDAATLDRALAEYKALPQGSAIRLMLGDYKQLRDMVRKCREQG